ncbi:putative cholesterol 7-alpha-monooxygenase [Halenospora varia]|nr:putative cholesterol 7-alpha-monooxygenase [Halenospora varia]
MNSTSRQAVLEATNQSGLLSYILFLAIPIFATYWWTVARWKIAKGEPPLVPYRIPWLGHGLSFMNDINGFTEYVRSIHPSSPAATVQIAGQHLYLIFDTTLASTIYRRSQTFIFDPFFLQTSAILGANKKDLRTIETGAQVVNPKPNLDDNGNRIIHDLHKMTPQYLTGQSLDRLTDMFVEVICKDIDTKFPEGEEKSYEWQTMDLNEFVKDTWAHASITALFGSHVYDIWPEINAWLWKFDKHFQSMFTGMPRFVIPTAFALLDEGQEMCERWETDALQAEKEGKIGGERDWDEYWGLKFVRVRNELLRENNLSAKFRAGNMVVFLWGLNANAIPMAMQTLNQALLHPHLLPTLLSEIQSSLTGPSSFSMKRVISQPLFKSMYLETLRWATASPSPRVVRQDCQLGDFWLRKGNMAIVHSRTLQMDRETWYVQGKPESEPQKFWPERFLGGDSESERLRIDENREAETNWSEDISRKPGDSKHPIPKELSNKKTEPIAPNGKDLDSSPEMKRRMLALRPFGGGTTLCPGRHFATNEIMGGLAALLLRLEVEVLEDELKQRGSPVPDMGKQGGLFPDRPLMVRMRRRRG